MNMSIRTMSVAVLTLWSRKYEKGEISESSAVPCCKMSFAFSIPEIILPSFVLQTKAEEEFHVIYGLKTF